MPRLRAEPTPVEFRLTPAQLEAELARWEPFLRDIAGNWYRAVNGATEIEDLRQAARLGVMRAAERFDTRRGVKFITFAKLFADIECRILCKETVAAGFSVPRDMWYKARPVRLDRVNPHARGPLSSIIASRTAGVEEVQEARELLASVWDLVRRLVSAQHYRVLVLQFREGLNSVVVARQLGLSRERVRQLRCEAIAKLRKNPTFYVAVGAELPIEVDQEVRFGREKKFKLRALRRGF